MREMFRTQNPGLKSRFDENNWFILPDYKDEELREILYRQCLSRSVTMAHTAVEAAMKRLVKERCKPQFGNARVVENLVKAANVKMMSRDNSCRKLTVEDIAIPEACSFVMSPHQLRLFS